VYGKKAVIAADDWFDKFNEGQFNAEKLSEAHEWCFILSSLEQFIDKDFSKPCWEITFLNSFIKNRFCDQSLYRNFVSSKVIVNGNNLKEIKDTQSDIFTKVETIFENNSGLEETLL